MKRVLVLPTILLAGAMLLSACGFGMIRGSGKVVEETRPVSGFDSIASSGSGDVIITQGDQESLKVEAEENLMRYIRTEVRGNTLHIFMDPSGAFALQPTKPMKFYVSLKQLNGLALSGSGTMKSEKIETADLDINASGSGNVVINDLKADTVKIDLSGSGETTLKGEAATQKMVLSGSGRCENDKLVTRDTSVDASGSGGASVNVSDTLNVNLSGSGSVDYTGTARVTQHVSGSGHVSSN
jgi:predicted small secreted protein